MKLEAEQNSPHKIVQEEFHLRPEHEHWLQLFLQNNQRNNRSRHTHINYRIDLRQFLWWFEQQYQRPITSADANSIGLYSQFMAKQQALIPAPPPKKWWQKLIPLARKAPSATPLERPSPLAPASRKRHLSSIKNFFEFLKQAHEDLPGKEGKLFQINPVKNKLHRIKLKDVDVIPTPMLTREHYAKLDQFVTRPRDRALMALFYYSGARLSEITNLNYQDIFFQTGQLQLLRKGGDMHLLSIYRWDLLLPELQRFLRVRGNDDGPFFQNKKGQRLSERALSHAVESMMKKCDVQIQYRQQWLRPGPHSFRKACATELYLATKDLLFVRDYLNHSDAKVTQTYIDRETLARFSTQSSDHSRQ